MHNTATATSVSCRGRWTALNIVLMVIGFAIFWPLGLAMLAWIIWGDEIARKAESVKGQLRCDARRIQQLPEGAAPGEGPGGIRPLHARFPRPHRRRRRDRLSVASLAKA
jgi:hypothetical protein